MTEHEIEYVAREIYGATWVAQTSPDAPTWDQIPPGPARERFMSMARAAIEALDAARTENGLVTVPREPTEEMWVAEREAIDVGVSPWHAMLDVLLRSAPKTVTIPHEGVVHD